MRLADKIASNLGRLGIAQNVHNIQPTALLEIIMMLVDHIQRLENLLCCQGRLALYDLLEESESEKNINNPAGDQSQQEPGHR